MANSETYNGDPLSLHVSDDPHIPLTNIKLHGANFPSWSKSVKIGLRKNGKLGFIDGKCVKPAENSPTYMQWVKCDSLVLSWLLLCMTDNLCGKFLHVGSAKQLWDELVQRFGPGRFGLDKFGLRQNSDEKFMFGNVKLGFGQNQVFPRSDIRQSNGLLLYHLEKKITHLCQNDCEPISVYLAKLKGYWDKVSEPVCLCEVRCPCVGKMYEIEEKRRLMQFLVGLNKDYDAVRRQILIQYPLPSVNEAYDMLQRVERQPGIAAKNLNFKAIKANKFCHHWPIENKKRQSAANVNVYDDDTPWVNRQSNNNAKPQFDTDFCQEMLKTTKGKVVTDNCQVQGHFAAGTSSFAGPISEEEVRNLLLRRAPITSKGIVHAFQSRLGSHENRQALLDILKKIATRNKGTEQVFLKEHYLMNSSRSHNYVTSVKSELPSISSSSSTSTKGPISEEEVRNVLSRRAPTSTLDAVQTLKPRLKSQENRKAPSNIVKKITKEKRINGQTFIMAKSYFTPVRSEPSTEGPISEKEIKKVLLERSPIATSDIEDTFRSRLKSPENRKAFAIILKKIACEEKINGQNFLMPRYSRILKSKPRPYPDNHQSKA